MPAIYLIFAIAACVWLAVFLLRGPLLVGCFAFLVTACCFGHEFYQADLGPLPFTIDRALLVVLGLAYLVQQAFGRTDPKPMQPADMLLFCFAGLLTVSTALSGDDTYVPGIMPTYVRLGVGYLMPIVIYWIARQSAITERSLRMLYGCLVGFGVYLGITALLEIGQHWSLVFPAYIADPEVGLHFGRARGPMVHSVSLGIYLGVCALCAWNWWPALGRKAQLAVIVVSPLFIAATYFTYTRSAWLGLALGALILLAIKLQGRWRTAMLASLVTAGALLVTTRLDQLVEFRRDETTTASDTRKSVEMRSSFTYVSWKMFLDRPLLGFGFGQFYLQKMPYLSDRATHLTLEEIRPYIHHNTLLSLLTEVGIVGLGLFLACLALWGRAAWRLWRSDAPDWARAHAALFLCTLGVYIFPLLGHELSYTPINHALLFCLAGITKGLEPLACWRRPSGRLRDAYI